MGGASCTMLNAQALALLMQQAKLRKGMLGATASQSAGTWLKDDRSTLMTLSALSEMI